MEHSDLTAQVAKKERKRRSTSPLTIKHLAGASIYTGFISSPFPLFLSAGREL
jgi:hypothetical protein